jgi:crotonobetainyl-CoA:carnitine CoA-transferase CaiB-like acyl-CoA transferase
MPLSDLRVLEVAGRIPSAYCGRLLADLGADVVLVGEPREPLVPEGPPLSRGLWMALHRNKRRSAIALGSDGWRSALADADLVIVEGGPAVVEGLGLDAARPEHLVVTAISSFGQAGLRSHWIGSDLVDAAYGGGCNTNGEPGRPPLRAPASLGDHELGVNAAVASLVALAAADRDGLGQLVDVSGVDAWATLQTGLAILEFMFQGRQERRVGHRAGGRAYPYTLLPCKDGMIRLICLVGREWKRAIEMMGDPDWAFDSRYADRMRNQELYADELDALVGAWLAEHTTAEVLAAADEHRVPCVPIQSLSDVLDDAHLAFHHYFWADRELRLPGHPARLSRTPARWRSSAPVDPVPGSAFTSPRTACPTREAAEAPLAGIRVLDFGWAWAGSVLGGILGDFGADVIKIESVGKLDPMRMDRQLVGDKPDYNQGALHHNTNRNKRSVEIDLGADGGPDAVRRLVEHSDVFVENLSTGVMARYGLDYDTLKEINPRLVYVSIAATSRSGPYANLRCYAPILTALAGIDALTGYEGERMVGLRQGFADPNASLHATVATLAALRERQRSGLGQYVEVSQLESLVSMLGGYLAALQLGDAEVAKAIGDADPLYAPHNVYPTLGEDRWVAIACTSDAEWEALRLAMGAPEWSADPSLSEAAVRVARRDWLDERIAKWTATRDAWAIAEQLQDAGVPAAPLLTSEDRMSDEHLFSREALVIVDHPVVGSELIHGVPWRLDRTPGRVRAAAPLLGADTAAVFAEVLGEEAPALAHTGAKR